MEIKECITRLKLFYHTFLSFVDDENDLPDSFQQIITIFRENNFGENPDELRSLLHIIYKITSQHKRNSIFMDKISKIIVYFEDKIKQTFSNLEIFKFFKKDKLLLLLLIKQKILIVDENIAALLIEIHGRFYSNFFYPEIKPFLEAFKKNSKTFFIENQQIYSEDFEKNRQEGENESEVCKLIRKDSLDEFISIYNDQQLKPSNLIQRSLFETNIYLTKNSISLFEYAAFFGSINIFKFLFNNTKELPLSLWNLAIRSGKIELIHFLEEMKVELKNYFYERCFLNAVKCHYNNIAHYLIDTLFKNKDINFIEDYFGYYNFEFFPDDFKENFESIFEYACHYDYVIIIKILLDQKKIDINIAISNHMFF